MLLNIIQITTNVMEMTYCIGSCIISIISVIVVHDLQKNNDNPLIVSSLLNKEIL